MVPGKTLEEAVRVERDASSTRPGGRRSRGRFRQRICPVHVEQPYVAGVALRATGACYSAVVDVTVSLRGQHQAQGKGPSVDLSITRADHGAHTVVHLGGEIDVYTAPFVREKLDEQIYAGRTDLIADLSDVTFLDSTGLGVLVGRLKLVRSRGGSLRLVGTADRVLRVFAITGLDKVFEIHPDLESALRSAAEPETGALGAVAEPAGRSTPPTPAPGRA